VIRSGAVTFFFLSAPQLWVFRSGSLGVSSRVLLCVFFPQSPPLDIPAGPPPVFFRCFWTTATARRPSVSCRPFLVRGPLFRLCFFPGLFYFFPPPPGFFGGSHLWFSTSFISRGSPAGASLPRGCWRILGAVRLFWECKRVCWAVSPCPSVPKVPSRDQHRMLFFTHLSHPHPPSERGSLRLSVFCRFEKGMFHQMLFFLLELALWVDALFPQFFF